MSGEIHLKVFLSSPGDVADERQAIVRLIKDELPYDPLLRGRVTFDVLAWDDRAQRVALLAGQSGQASVDGALGFPADCDLTVVVVRTRLGTPPDDRPPKPDGTPWRSGTEWELWNALNAGRDVLVCRGPTTLEIDFGDPDKAQQQLDQAKFARQFLVELAEKKILLNEYKDISELLDLVEQQIKRLARARLDTSGSFNLIVQHSRFAANNLPPSNPEFVGRERVLADLRLLLTNGHGPAVLTQVITGLGGIGKTQTARAFAYRHLDNYGLVWWLRAEDPVTLSADYLGLAAPLGLDPSVADQAQLISMIKQRLQGMPAWLLIFDNVDDPSLPREWLPSTGAGHALFTSRRTDWQGSAKALRLDEMSESEALHVLTGRSDPQSLPRPELAAARELAAELGYLPLALAQTRAYVAETGKTLAGYLVLFRSSRPGNLAGRLAEADYPASYATTWRISITAASAACPGAKQLLELLAFVAPTNFPIAILAVNTALLPRSLRSELARDNAIAALRRYSLIETVPGFISVHRLVQAVTRDKLRKGTARRTAITALNITKNAIPREPENYVSWSRIRLLLPHIFYITKTAIALEVGTVSTASALNSVGMYYHSRASWKYAHNLYRRALALLHGKLSNPPTPMELVNYHIIQSNIGRLYSDTGRHGAAAQLIQQALEVNTRLLGATHPLVASSSSELGLVYVSLHRFAEAESLLKRAASTSLTHFGPQHSVMATRLNNLGLLYEAMGRYTLVEELYLRAINISKATIGCGHPDHGTRLNNLANFYTRNGLHLKAEPLYRQVIQIAERTIGKQHPKLAMWFNNLSFLYQEMGRYEEARGLLDRASAIVASAFGSNHPEMAALLSRLAGLHCADGDLIAAETLYKHSLGIIEGALGPGHLQLTTPLTGLTKLYIRMGRMADAEAAIKRAELINVRHFRQSDLGLAITLLKLAELNQSIGQQEVAERQLLQVIQIREKQLGSNHPDLAAALNRLASMKYLKNYNHEAEILHTRALTITEKAFGREHPIIVPKLINFAEFYRAENRLLEAERMLIRAVKIARSNNGGALPIFMGAYNNLAHLYRIMKRMNEAEDLYLSGIANVVTTLGEGHYLVGFLLSNLADLYREYNEPEKAEACRLRMVEIRASRSALRGSIGHQGA